MPRPKRPTALYGVDGGKRRPDEPVPSSTALKMPRGMSPRAQAQYKLLAPDLEAKGVLTAWDLPLFQLLCETYETAEIAYKAILEHGPLIRGRGGELVKNPALQVRKDAIEQIRRLGGQFGLSPSDRASLKVTPTKRERDSLDKFIYEQGDLREFTD